MNAVLGSTKVDQIHDFTSHAWERMSARGFSPSGIHSVLMYGRVAHARKAMIHVVGRKEVARYRRVGVDISDLEGVHVVCSTDGAIITVYRNKDLRGIRPRRRHANRPTARWYAG